MFTRLAGYFGDAPKGDDRAARYQPVAPDTARGKASAIYGVNDGFSVAMVEARGFGCCHDLIQRRVEFSGGAVALTCHNAEHYSTDELIAAHHFFYCFLLYLGSVPQDNSHHG